MKMHNNDPTLVRYWRNIGNRPSLFMKSSISILYWSVIGIMLYVVTEWQYLWVCEADFFVRMDWSACPSRGCRSVGYFIMY